MGGGSAVADEAAKGRPTQFVWPKVGVIMPLLNEGRHLEEAVDAVLSQDYAGSIRLVLALGPSVDDTNAVAQRLVDRNPNIRTVDNPSGLTPLGLNAALAALDSDVEIVVRVDGHGILDRDYVRVACQLLNETGAANVGGLMDAVGVTAFERAAAAAMTSPLGVGPSPFHVGGQEGPADTVYLGVFRRVWLERMKGYDPRFVRAQDWELNHRIRQAGGTVWFSPRLRVAYRPRATLAALRRQYLLYGRWRRVVSRTHSGTMNPRYLAPPLALVGVVVGSVAGMWCRRAWWVPAAYFAGTTIGGLSISADLRPQERALMPAILPTMHLAWGWGFLTSRVRLDDLPVDDEPSAPEGKALPSCPR